MKPDRVPVSAVGIFTITYPALHSPLEVYCLQAVALDRQYLYRQTFDLLPQAEALASGIAAKGSIDPRGWYPLDEGDPAFQTLPDAS